MRKIAAVIGIFVLLVLSPVAMGSKGGVKAGEHRGEVKQLDVEIQFSNSFGTTVTDSTGTYYLVWGYTFKEDKIYTPEYWGSYPLYFFGTEVGVTVKVTNHGPRKKAKVLIKTEAYVLKVDGTNGVALKDPTTIELTVYRGETKCIDASFVSEWAPGAESGLDRFVVKVLHPNNGGGPGNSEPALIMSKEGVFCPPELEMEL